MSTKVIDIFDISEPGARSSDPWSSHEAAALFPTRRMTDRIRVLLVHDTRPDGLTDFELADIVGRQQTSAGKRRCELMKIGLIEQTVLHRQTPSGARAIVWKITESGQALARLVRASH